MKGMQDAGNVVSRRERRKGETRSRLLDVAERLFGEKGFEATTVEEIAEAADVAKGTFFNYFENKNALIFAVVISRLSSLLQAPPGVGLPAPDRIQLTMKHLWLLLLPYRDLAQQAFVHGWSNPPTSPPGPRMADTMAELVREGQAEGIFRRDMDAQIAGELLAACFVRFSLLSYLAGEAEDLSAWEKRIQAGTALLYQGMLIA